MKKAIALAAALLAGAAGGAGGRWWHERGRPAREAYAAAAAGQPGFAGRWAEEALAIAPNDPGLLSLVARGRESAGDLEGAAKTLAKIPAWTPADRLTSARLFKMTGQSDQADGEAAKLLDTALKPEALRIRAWAARRQGKAAVAVGFAEQALAAGERTPGLLELAQCQEAAGRAADALQSLRAAFAEPDWPTQPAPLRAGLQLHEIHLLSAAGRPADALAAAAKLDPELAKSPPAAAVRGAAKLRAGDLDGAEQDLTAAIATPERAFEAELDFAELQLRRGRPDAALGVLEAFERMPNPPPRAVELRKQARAAKPAPPAAK